MGTSSEIYEYIKLLYARIGKTISPKTGNEIRKDNVNSVLDFIRSFSEGDKFIIMSKLNPPQDFNIADFLAIYSSQGFARVEINNKILLIEDFKESKFDNVYLVIDRSIFSKNDDYLNRKIH